MDIFSNPDPSIVTIAALGGLLPALVWLWFWIREDEHPEPLPLIALSFMVGMSIVPFVLPLQKLALDLYAAGSFSLIFIWALVEEVYKYAAALLLILWRKDVDEPIDYVVYMIVIAIGFSALENILYIYKVATEASILESLLNGSFRFLGASLIHIGSSATVGIAMAYAFYKKQSTRLLYGLVGLSTATLLHALFNFTILNATEARVQTIFLGVWFSVILLLLIMERVKRIART